MPDGPEISKLRAGSILTVFLLFTVPLMPVQWVFTKSWPWAARHFPHWYHRQVCRLIGIRLDIEGSIDHDRPVLLISNHTSWLDIPVLSAVAPVSFVAKKEVGTLAVRVVAGKIAAFGFHRSSTANCGWRQRQRNCAAPATERCDRAVRGRHIERRQSRAAIFVGAVCSCSPSSPRTQTEADRDDAFEQRPAKEIAVQTIAIVYTKLGGVPLSREQRPHVGWYGDMEMTSHAWAALGRGPLDVSIRIGQPVELSIVQGPQGSGAPHRTRGPRNRNPDAAWPERIGARLNWRNRPNRSGQALNPSQRVDVSNSFSVILATVSHLETNEKSLFTGKIGLCCSAKSFTGFESLRCRLRNPCKI